MRRLLRHAVSKDTRPVALSHSSVKSRNISLLISELQAARPEAMTSIRDTWWNVRELIVDSPRVGRASLDWILLSAGISWEGTKWMYFNRKSELPSNLLFRISSLKLDLWSWHSDYYGKSSQLIIRIPDFHQLNFIRYSVINRQWNFEIPSTFERICQGNFDPAMSCLSWCRKRSMRNWCSKYFGNDNCIR